ncbi:MAG: transcriptional regulator [Muribaculaceae bacterium]|nr:transcriptional regulator [Muribaculaceae bacterium]
MKKTFVLLSWLLLMGAGMSVALDFNLQDYYLQIDEAINHSPEYVAKHEVKIGVQRKALERETTPSGKFQCNYRLYELYKPFVSDSAIYFLNQCIKLAEQMNDPSALVRCRSLLAIRSANIGMYDEALCMLDSINTEGADTLALGTYYEAYNNVYSELSYYTRLDDMRKIYLDKAHHYEQLMMKHLPPTSEACFLRRELRAQGEGRFDESMRINNEWLATVEPGSHPYALVALYRYIEFKLQGNNQEMMHWLVESVLTDIKNATMDQGSMWELANELMLQGDIERASRYISFTSDCANRYGSRQRNWQIAPLLTAISKNYKENSERTTTQLRITIALVSVLALLLLGALLFLHRRHKQLKEARNKLHDTNSQLETLNENLKTANEQLSEKNEQFSELNAQLSESNRVKEEYIGRFMSLCSQYIDKLDAYRRMVNKKMRNKELDELFQISKSTELKETELEELYENFDSVFLHLFPHFVEDFNALLQPEAQVHPKEENRLTTEIRIFALIRLGIEDSSKIAEFLHYSVNTIYNYRARIKNGAIASREQFEQHVKKLGQIQ